MTYRSGNRTATTTAAGLVSAVGTSVNRVLIQNRGAVNVLIGDSASQDYLLGPGESLPIVSEDSSNFDLSTIYIKAESSTCVVGWNGHSLP